MPRKPAQKLLFAAAALIAAAIYLEFTGYRDFDTRRGESALCRIDPSCRGLVETEIASAREIFGDALDYSKVKIFNRPSYATIPAKLVVGFGGIAETPNGNVYYQDNAHYRDDMTDDPEALSILFHELTHAWQYQTKEHLLLSAIREYIDADYDYKALYDYDINGDREFSQLGIEQQASIVEDYQALRSSFDAAADKQEWLKQHCSAISQYERKLRQLLPLRPFGGCSTD